MTLGNIFTGMLNFTLQHKKRPAVITCTNLDKETTDILRDHLKVSWPDFFTEMDNPPNKPVSKSMDFRVFLLGSYNKKKTIQCNIDTYMFIDALKERYDFKVKIELCETHNSVEDDIICKNENKKK